jgi:hypothetical protein
MGNASQRSVDPVGPASHFAVAIGAGLVIR